MREILFRGKRIDNHEWVIGDGIHYPKSFNYINTCWIDGMAKRANDWVEVNPETIGQYTGLEDKNGIKIFEGDIVKLLFEGTTIIGKVEYRRVSYFVGDGHVLWEIKYYKEIEIIGNIYDNPELLMKAIKFRK